MAAVDGDELIGFLIETVPRKLGIGVRNHDRFEFGIIEVFGLRTFGKRTAVTPVAVHGENNSPARSGLGGTGHLAKGIFCQHPGHYCGASFLDEVSSLHSRYQFQTEIMSGLSLSFDLALSSCGRFIVHLRTHTIHESNCCISVTAVDSVPRGRAGEMATASP